MNIQTEVERAKTQLGQALLEYGKATGNAEALELSLRLALTPSADLVDFWHEPKMRHTELP